MPAGRSTGGAHRRLASTDLIGGGHSDSTLSPPSDSTPASAFAAYPPAGSAAAAGAMAGVRGSPSAVCAVAPLHPQTQAHRLSVSKSAVDTPRLGKHVSFAPGAVFSSPSAWTVCMRSLLRCMRQCCRRRPTPVRYVTGGEGEGDAKSDTDDYGYGSEDSF